MRHAVMWMALAAMAGNVAAGEPDVRQQINAVYEVGHFYVLPSIPGSKPLRLLVDTGGAGGSGLFVLAAATVKRLGWNTRSCGFGNAEIPVVDAPLLAASLPSPSRATPCHATAMVLPDKVFGAGNLDGILGAGYLPGQTWTFDYPHQQLWREASHWTPTPRYHEIAMELPHDPDGHPAGLPRIHLRIDGEDLPMLLDTGATAKPTAAGEQAAGTPTVHGYGVTSYAPRSLIDRWHTHHPEWPVVENGDDLVGHSRLIRVPQVQIAGWSVGPVWFTERPDRNIDNLENYMSGPVQGSAGANIYQHFVMTLDYQHGKAYFACATGCRLFIVTKAAATARSVITTQAALDAYLKETPKGASPLDQFSPGARTRFLASLGFTPRGLGTFGMDDASNELTKSQAAAVYALFGLQTYTQGIGLDDAKAAQLRGEREADAKRRGCAVDQCPESDIEQRYDHLVLAKENFALPDQARFDAYRQHYEQLFGMYQNPATIRSVSAPDLRLLKRAAQAAVSLDPHDEEVGQLHFDLAEMGRRGMADDTDYAGLYHALITLRQFDAARQLSAQHPKMGGDSLPTIHVQSPLHEGWPTALSLDRTTNVATREAFDLSTPLRIVVVASCHFSQDATRAIESDPSLHALFVKHAIWLASQDEAFDQVRDWNTKFPDMPIDIAWQEREWTRLDSWAMPTFYVFKNGQLSGKFAGWNGIPSLRESLKKMGAIPVAAPGPATK
ncbi:hypothetical protein [Dyella mobilis]|uniref:Thioredoxin domain-containing protein n=1 Tax=Dyella mobilis TaxID=1849582 RepID=A0ABS2KEC9_9GAMM|nr:hypothetical protein [Dyella mobilis]MBM7129516.1 hypothetical protein [Dyella mobilis]GLQ98219.1 hypothetical protein GCM10007863_26390 [Dyella mobilis]